MAMHTQGVVALTRLHTQRHRFNGDGDSQRMLNSDDAPEAEERSYGSEREHILEEEKKFVEFWRGVNRAVTASNTVSGQYTSTNKSRAAALVSTFVVRDVFLPNHPLKYLWDVWLSLLVLYSVIVIPYYIGFGLEPTPQENSVDKLIIVCFGLDILVNFNTAYIDPATEKLVMRRRNIARNYLKFWFWADVLATIPFDLAFTSVVSGNGLVAIRLIRIFRLIRLVKLFRILKGGNPLEAKFNPGLVSLLLLLIQIFVIAHIFACFWHYIATNAPANDYENTWLTTFSFTEVPVVERYVASLYYIIVTMLTVGYGDIRATNQIERVYAIMTMLVGGIVFGALISQVTSLIDKRNPQAKAFQQNMNEFKLFLSTIGLPAPIQRKAKQAYAYHLNKKSAFGESGILEELPPVLLKELVTEIYSEDIFSIEMLRTEIEHNSAFVISIVKASRPFQLFSGELVVSEGDICNDIFFLRRGIVSFEPYRSMRVKKDIMRKKRVSLKGSDNAGSAAHATAGERGIHRSRSRSSEEVFTGESAARESVRVERAHVSGDRLRDDRCGSSVEEEEGVELRSARGASPSRLPSMQEMHTYLVEDASALPPMESREHAQDNVVGFVTEGHLFGDVEMIKNTTALATYRAVNHCHLFAVSHKHFKAALAESFNMTEKFDSFAKDRAKSLLQVLHQDLYMKDEKRQRPAGLAKRGVSFSHSRMGSAPRSSFQFHGRKKSMTEDVHANRTLWVDGQILRGEDLNDLQLHKRQDQQLIRVMDYDVTTKILREKEKPRHILRERYLLDPTGKGKITWDVFIGVLILYSVLIVPVELGFNNSAFEGSHVADVIINCFFGVDILLAFRTAYTSSEHDALVIYGPQVAKNYFLGWFSIDFFSTVPFDQLANLGSGTSTNLVFIRLLKTVRLARLLKMARILKLGRYLDLFEEYSGIPPAAFQLVGMLFQVFFIAHLIACLWWGLAATFPSEGIREPYVAPWFEQSSMFFNRLTGTSVASQYLASIYFTFTTITTVGYGDIYAQSVYERILAIFIVLVGASLFGYTLASVAAALNSVSGTNTVAKERLVEIIEYLKEKNCSSTIALRVFAHFQRKFGESSFDLSRVANALPPRLSTVVLYAVHDRRLQKIPIFRYIHKKSVVVYLFNYLQPCFLETGEYLIRQDGPVESIHFLVSGEAVAFCRLQKGGSGKGKKKVTLAGLSQASRWGEKLARAVNKRDAHTPPLTPSAGTISHVPTGAAEYGGIAAATTAGSSRPRARRFSTNSTPPTSVREMYGGGHLGPLPALSRPADDSLLLPDKPPLSDEFRALHIDTSGSRATGGLGSTHGESFSQPAPRSSSPPSESSSSSHRPPRGPAANPSLTPRVREDGKPPASSGKTPRSRRRSSIFTFSSNHLIEDAVFDGVDKPLLALTAREWQALGLLLLGPLVEGEFVGHRQLMTRTAVHSYSVKACTPCTVFILTKTDLNKLIRLEPTVGAQLQAALVQAIRVQTTAMDKKYRKNMRVLFLQDLRTKYYALGRQVRVRRGAGGGGGGGGVDTPRGYPPGTTAPPLAVSAAGQASSTPRLLPSSLRPLSLPLPSASLSLTPRSQGGGGSSSGGEASPRLSSTSRSESSQESGGAGGGGGGRRRGTFLHDLRKMYYDSDDDDRPGAGRSVASTQTKTQSGGGSSSAGGGQATRRDWATPFVAVSRPQTSRETRTLHAGGVSAVGGSPRDGQAAGGAGETPLSPVPPLSASSLPWYRRWARHVYLAVAGQRESHATPRDRSCSYSDFENHCLQERAGVVAGRTRRQSYPSLENDLWKKRASGL